MMAWMVGGVLALLLGTMTIVLRRRSWQRLLASLRASWGLARERQRDLRYYFRLDRTMPAEDPALRAQSEANLSEVASQVRAGGSVNFIFGYASPEATERHNADLSLARATRPSSDDVSALFTP